ncbi:MAG TPA: hypothetical protein PKD17_06115 [Cellvibrionaceae bacterium]|nr:hypothetical protein [Cellvibrionaceae bacterium]HMW71374.1 hypothetical protein [Cellvibrionaceae bacterium]HMY37871.1 hypothetical protein [Marinagarivorans sp.]HNG58945.1 hypothetical protein [Cellvibrionaceae bacterium]
MIYQQIAKEAHDWAIETMGNPKYPLELFMRVITVKPGNNENVNGLPKLEME